MSMIQKPVNLNDLWHRKRLMHGLDEIKALCIKLELSNFIIMYAQHIFHNVYNKHLLSGRNIKAAYGACLYLACRTSGTVIGSHELSHHLKMRERDMMRYYRLVLKEFEISVPNISYAKYLESKFAVFNLPEQIKRSAMRILNILETNQDVSKHPWVLVGSVLWVVCKEREIPLSYEIVSKKLNVSVPALMECAIKVRNILKIQGIYHLL